MKILTSAQLWLVNYWPKSVITLRDISAYGPNSVRDPTDVMNLTKRRDREAKRLGGLKIDREPVLRQRLYWHVGSAISVQRSFVPRK
jgi:hypothetical protein